MEKLLTVNVLFSFLINYLFLDFLMLKGKLGYNMT